MEQINKEKLSGKSFTERENLQVKNAIALKCVLNC